MKLNIYAYVILLGMLPRRPKALSPAEIQLFGDFVIEGDRELTIRTTGIPVPRLGVFSDVTPHDINFNVPRMPSYSDDIFCLPNRLIGVAIDGVPIYSPYTEACCNAGIREYNSMDGCWGKKDASGRYFYNVPPLCLFKNICNQSSLVGVALDGFPIYGPYDETGSEVTAADLDECNGRLDVRRSYRYHLTVDFPYILRCFRGAPIAPQNCSCESLASPCPSGTPEPVPFNVTGEMGQITEFTCCEDENNCETIKNSHYSSAQGAVIGGRGHSLNFALVFITVLLWI